ALIFKEIGIDGRRRSGISRSKTDRALAMRAQYTGVAAKPMSTDFFAAMVFQHGGHEMKLDVRRRNIGAGSPETTGFCIRRGHNPGALHPVLQYRPCHAKRAGK